jgi:KilA-N domain
MTDFNLVNIIREYNGKTVRQREDGYLSATDMCLAFGKLFGGWNRLESTKEYLKALQNKHYANQHNGQLVEIKVGGTPETTGTWVHRKVALRLAQWLSPDFAVQVDEWIEELLTKGYVISQQATSAQLNDALSEITQLKAEKARIEAEMQTAQLLNSQMLAHIESVIEKEKVAVKASYECYTDDTVGNPIVFTKHMSEELTALREVKNKLIRAVRANEPSLLQSYAVELLLPSREN